MAVVPFSYRDAAEISEIFASHVSRAGALAIGTGVLIMFGVQIKITLPNGVVIDIIAKYAKAVNKSRDDAEKQAMSRAKKLFLYGGIAFLIGGSAFAGAKLALYFLRSNAPAAIDWANATPFLESWYNGRNGWLQGYLYYVGGHFSNWTMETRRLQIFNVTNGLVTKEILEIAFERTSSFPEFLAKVKIML